MIAYWILGDQLTSDHPALRLADDDDCFLFIESRARSGQLRYHRHKLVLIYSAMRHYAEDLRARGRKVHYDELDDTPAYEDALCAFVKKHQPSEIVVMEPNEWEMAQTLPKLSRKTGVAFRTVSTSQFLVPRAEFHDWSGGKKHLLMASHYQNQRRKLGILLDDNGGPVGGKWSFDADNRATFAQYKKHAPDPAPPPTPKHDTVTRAVMRAVARHFPDHPGDPETFWLPVTRKGALEWLDHFIQHRLPLFGPYEDLMAQSDPLLYHSVLSPLLNIGLLTPRECVDRAIEAFKAGHVPINSVEGFIRQIIGWREFINGVYWLDMPDCREANELDAHRPLPAWIYSGETGMNCVSSCIRQATATGYNHHIQRLMVLGNFFLLGGYEPKAVLRWYMEMYVDAYDWVMQPNVMGMVLYADGGRFATKPYAAGSGYITKMGDYCASCRYSPKEKTGPRACPFNYLYWNFFDRHARRFAANPRTSMMVRTLEKKSAAEREQIRAGAEGFLR